MNKILSPSKFLYDNFLEEKLENLSLYNLATDYYESNIKPLNTSLSQKTFFKYINDYKIHKDVIISNNFFDSGKNNTRYGIFEPMFIYIIFGLEYYSSLFKKNISDFLLDIKFISIKYLRDEHEELIEELNNEAKIFYTNQFLELINSIRTHYDEIENFINSYKQSIHLTNLKNELSKSNTFIKYNLSNFLDDFNSHYHNINLIQRNRYNSFLDMDFIDLEITYKTKKYNTFDFLSHASEGEKTMFQLLKFKILFFNSSLFQDRIYHTTHKFNQHNEKVPNCIFIADDAFHTLDNKRTTLILNNFINIFNSLKTDALFINLTHDFNMFNTFAKLFTNKKYSINNYIIENINIEKLELTAFKIKHTDIERHCYHSYIDAIRDLDFYLSIFYLCCSSVFYRTHCIKINNKYDDTNFIFHLTHDIPKHFNKFSKKISNIISHNINPQQQIIQYLSINKNVCNPDDIEFFTSLLSYTYVHLLKNNKISEHHPSTNIFRAILMRSYIDIDYYLSNQNHPKLTHIKSRILNGKLKTKDFFCQDSENFKLKSNFSDHFRRINSEINNEYLHNMDNQFSYLLSISNQNVLKEFNNKATFFAKKFKQQYESKIKYCIIAKQ